MSRHGHHNPAKGPSQRQLRVGEELRHAIAWILERGELRDPAIANTPVTVTEVRVSPDLKNATCFVTPLGGGEPDAVAEVVGALSRARKFLRHEVVRKVNLKYAPQLHFEHDTSFDTAGHIDELLHRPDVARDLHHDDDEED
ncbi:30S ribosome-binding factor RbfA [Magnetovibrio sp. PR-2]|uniref:30S ribosome-binding factor RbfA n=1 Tax=Magnetovibrio sp. PR-2 TaxID=3120356 RepID=UPI002FCE4052